MFEYRMSYGLSWMRVYIRGQHSGIVDGKKLKCKKGSFSVVTVFAPSFIKIRQLF